MSATFVSVLQKYAAHAMLGAAAVVIAAGGAVWLLNRPTPRQVEIVVPTPAPVVVQVEGAVVSPGVYELAQGARVRDAVDAAGGFSPSADVLALNQASRIADGARLAVPELASSPDRSSGVSAVPTAPPSSPQTAGLVDLNTATREELESLPGIGAARAGLIIDFRIGSGPIGSVDDLLAISGIGEKTVDAMRPLVVQQ